jgi:hypothetical protein
MITGKKLLLAAVCLLPMARQTVLAQYTPDSPLPAIQLVQQADPVPSAAGMFPATDLTQSRVPTMLSSYLGPSIRIDQSVLTSRTIPVTTTIVTPTQVVTRNSSGQRVVTTVNQVSSVTTQQTIFQRQIKSYRIPEAGRGFRISDNESPDTQDRVFYRFNYWDPIYHDANNRLGNNGSVDNVIRNTIGFEKTLFDGGASFEARLPFESIKLDSSLVGGGESTAIGDLSLISKFRLYHCDDTGNTISAGLAVTLPTGPRSFANINEGLLEPPHRAGLQPFVGYLWRSDRIYVHGFSAVDIPIFDQDVLLMYNDIGVGYMLRQADCGLTLIAPTVELRVTTPLNHNGVLNGQRYGETDILELLGGVNFELNHRTSFAVGASVPLTGPKPYDWQVLAQLNFRF